VDGKRVPDATLPFPFSGNVSRAPSAADIFYPFTAGRTPLHNALMRRFMLPALGLLLPIAVIAQEAKPPTTAPGTLLTIYSSARLDDFDASRLMKSNPGQIPAWRSSSSAARSI